MFSRKINYLNDQQQSLNKAMTFCLFTDFTVSFTVYLEVKLPHCQGWKDLQWFCTLDSEVSREWGKEIILSTWWFLDLNVVGNGHPAVFSHISHLVQAHWAKGVAAVKGCGALCSEHDVTRPCFSVERALDLGRNRQEKRQGMGRVKLRAIGGIKKETKQVNSLHVLHQVFFITSKLCAVYRSTLIFTGKVIDIAISHFPTLLS